MSKKLSDVNINAEELLNFLNTKVSFDDGGNGNFYMNYKIRMSEFTSFICSKFPKEQSMGLSEQHLSKLREAQKNAQKLDGQEIKNNEIMFRISGNDLVGILKKHEEKNKKED